MDNVSHRCQLLSDLGRCDEALGRRTGYRALRRTRASSSSSSPPGRRNGGNGVGLWDRSHARSGRCVQSPASVGCRPELPNPCLRRSICSASAMFVTSVDSDLAMGLIFSTRDVSSRCVSRQASRSSCGMLHSLCESDGPVKRSAPFPMTFPLRGFLTGDLKTAHGMLRNRRSRCLTIRSDLHPQN